MKRNTLVVILVIISLLSIVYAFFQQAAAAKAGIEAEANLVLANMAHSEMKKQMQVVQKQAEATEQAMIDLKDELAKCNGKK